MHKNRTKEDMALNIEFNGQTKRVRVTPGTTMVEQHPPTCALAMRLFTRARARAVQARGCDAVPALAPQPRGGPLDPVPIDGDLEQRYARAAAAGERSEGSTAAAELGIVSGSAIFRVQASQSKAPAKAPPIAEPVRTPAAKQPASVLVSEPKTEEKPQSPAAPVQPPLPAAPVQVPQSAFVNDGDEEMKESSALESASAPMKKLSSYEALQLLRDNCFDATARGAILTLTKIVTNILSYPENEKMRSIRVSNAAFQRSVGSLKGGIEFLESVEFTLDQETQCLVLKSAVDAKCHLEEGLRLLNNEADDLNIEEGKRPVVVVPRAADPDFDVYKPQITRMQAQPRGPSVTEVLVDNLKSKQDQLIGHEKPLRNTRATLPGQQSVSSSIRSTTSTMDVDMDEDEHPSDSRILISTLKAKRAEMEKAKNFRTQAMRELDELKKKKVFQTTLIRVQFPDRVVLQAAFHPNETVQDVVDHVRESLQQAFSGNQFYLYVTPPTQKLDPRKTLAELNLVPAALTYLSWIDALPSLEQSASGFYLRDELVADEYAETKESESNVAAVAYPKPISLEAPPVKVEETSDARSGAAAPKSSSAAAKGSSNKKPAWLKLSR
ncbi:Tether containing ubx domain for glut4, partial [Globisporangium splendens]